MEKFQTVMGELEGRLSSHYRLSRLQAVKVVGAQGRERVNDELLAYLHWAITGERHPVQLPSCPMYLDAMIGAQDFVGGTAPKVGDYSIRVVGIDGFPQESHPGLNNISKVTQRFESLNKIDAMIAWIWFCN